MSSSPASRWGLGQRQRDNLIRLATFSAFHILNWVANVAVFVHFFLHGEDWCMHAYVLMLGFAMVSVGVYCTRLAWVDRDVKNWTFWTRECFGLLCHLSLAVTLGFTQMMQLKVAYVKYTLRNETQLDDEEVESLEQDDEAEENGGQRRQRRRIAKIESIIPWAFPSKCFEGVFEGCVFALVLLYALLRMNWQDDVHLKLMFDYSTHTLWYYILSLSGVLSFCTVGISMLNLDYHLSPTVQNMVDHSMSYTFMHAVFRACEAGSRIVTIVLWLLLFRACRLGQGYLYFYIPHLILAAEYICCVVTLIFLSAPEESRYRSLQSSAGFFKRILCAMLVGLLTMIVNMTEFIDEAERGAMRIAAAMFSKYYRIVRFLELLILLGFLLMQVIWRALNGVCKLQYEHNYVGLLHYLLLRHKVVLLAFTLATTVYYSMVFLGFHNALLRPEQSQLGRNSSWLWRAIMPVVEFRPPSQPLLPSQEQVASRGTEPAPQPHPQPSMREVREVPITPAGEVDLPQPIRQDLSWYFNFGGQTYTTLRSPGISILVLSRGIPGPLARRVMTPVHEDETLPDDVICPSGRLQMSDFTLVETLGSGQYGRVYKCQRTVDGKVFAMKTLEKHNYERPRCGATDPFRERNTLRICGRHANVAALECAFEFDNFWVLITELCDGGSLQTFIKNHGHPGLSPWMTAHIMGEVLQGLDHLHSNCILHRDLKPDNIGLCGSISSPTAKIIDFGFAKRSDSRQSATIVGSWGYCPPEVEDVARAFGPLTQGREKYDQRVDIYPCGVCAFVAMVGSVTGPRIWTHRDLRAMLESENYVLWSCERYVSKGINSSDVMQRMEDCGALETIRALTASSPNDRPRTAVEAGRLPLFRNHVPSQWLVTNAGGVDVEAAAPSSP